ncbi:BamA/TamA family outer membrane protein [Marinilongibacter aquaticus]|uniref:translocation and assembly module lipoprotein TamL n=1 Tax=Marinilongibacter aquaticus TaxID=2975157 RepID=UPI0021BD3FB2|nr:BamA/TamA family outer membrane protein [Marinilongibacter aquaticus]UBM58966.1 BamA/TamA family outer membrane protein [Marinilongibacter aquaticus]
MRNRDILVGFCLVFLLASCGVYKRMPEEQMLYAGAEVEIQAKDAEKKEVARLKEEMDLALRPEPNAFLFGYPYKVGFHYLFANPKKEDGIKAKMQKRLGEKPVSISMNGLEQNRSSLLNYLDTEGYFRSKVEADLSEEKRKQHAHYKVDLAPRYTYSKIEINGDRASSNLGTQLLDDFGVAGEKVSLKVQDPYRFNDLLQSRRDINLALRNKGYYYFRPTYVKIEADSTVGNQGVDLFLDPVESLPSESQKQYLINDIIVHTSRAAKSTGVDSSNNGMDLFRGIILDDSSNFYKARIFEDAVGFRPGNFYSVSQDEVTNQRLIGLNNFQSVENRFEILPMLDSTLMDVHYYLLPKKRMSVRSELNALNRSSGFAGGQLSLIWRNNNLFKGAEILDISANFATEVQVGGKKSGSQYNNNYRISAEANLTFPRFVSPIFKVDPEISRILPKTSLTLGFNSIIKKGLYTLNSSFFSWGYIWRKGVKHEHVLTPFSVSLVKAKNISEEFVNEIFFDPRLLYILENQLITGGSYKYTFTPEAKGRNRIRFEGNLELVGNLAGLVDKLRNNPEKDGSVFGEIYKQYTRVDGDFRWYRQVTTNNQWANRIFLGLGIPYGNSNSLPYTRQYYSGGNSSIRAFRARGIGPGSYQRTGMVSEQFLGQFTGDIKIEMNTEWRYKLNDFLGTAFFVDAGNVWMYKDDLIYDETAVFSKDFYKELAVGAGVGLRFDFSYFILRLDLAFPLRRPDRPLGERWVIDEISWKNKESRILNIAIGMPF